MNQTGICLHIGCGLLASEGWENIDASPSLKISKIPVVGRFLLARNNGPKWPDSVKPGDVVKGLKINDSTCEIIFAAHVLEHLSLSDFHVAMSNIHSYLKPGGIFRTIVPDLKQYAETYINHHSDTALSAKAAQEFMELSLVGHRGSRNSLPQRLREAFANSRHQWMWDEPSLKDAFAQHGFKNIRRCYYGDWSDARFGTVEKENNYMNAIGIEGTK
jgi:hypothetical protein